MGVDCWVERGTCGVRGRQYLRLSFTKLSPTAKQSARRRAVCCQWSQARFVLFTAGGSRLPLSLPFGLRQLSSRSQHATRYPLRFVLVISIFMHLTLYTLSRLPPMSLSLRPFVSTPRDVQASWFSGGFFGYHLLPRLARTLPCFLNFPLFSSER